MSSVAPTRRIVTAVLCLAAVCAALLAVATAPASAAGAARAAGCPMAGGTTVFASFTARVYRLGEHRSGAYYGCSTRSPEPVLIAAATGSDTVHDVTLAGRYAAYVVRHNTLEARFDTLRLIDLQTGRVELERQLPYRGASQVMVQPGGVVGWRGVGRDCTGLHLASRSVEWTVSCGSGQSALVSGARLLWS